MINGEKVSFIEIFEKGLNLYREGHFDAALEKFHEALEKNSEDKPSRLFIKRCEYLTNTPPEKWNGVWDLG
ncbi:MAG TPA: tetratricopeptide repeat protein [Thermodesulfovibrionales bacterium]|nr:tetratricopeptide repeat protein [Thermodesulfovibrionales bacterium]